MQGCSAWEIKQAFTSYHNPQGNADTKRFMRSLKEERVWLQEWRSVERSQGFRGPDTGSQRQLFTFGFGLSIGKRV